VKMVWKSKIKLGGSDIEPHEVIHSFQMKE
jgi:hypothetical protein